MDTTKQQVIFTRVVETDVLGTKAYHVSCDCGFESSRKDRQSQALNAAQDHAASKHNSQRVTA